MRIHKRNRGGKKKRLKTALLTLLILLLTTQIFGVLVHAETLAQHIIDDWEFYVKYGEQNFFRKATRLFMDGREVFCVQAEKLSYDGDEYPDPIPASEVYNADKLHRVGLITLFGFEQTAKRDIDAAFTKLFVYEAFGYNISRLSDQSGQGVFTNNRYEQFKAEVEAEIAQYMKRASFHDTAIELEPGVTRSLKDENDVLSGYKVSQTPSGISATIEGNTLNLTAAAGALGGDLVLQRDTANNGTSLLYIRPNRQEIIESKIDLPRQTIVRLSVEQTGGFTLKKTSTDGKELQGAVFKLSGQGVEKELTLETGSLSVDGLKAGSYHVVETLAPSGYRLDPTPRSVTIRAGETPASNVVALTNDEKRGDIKIVKKNAEGGVVVGATFELSRSEDFSSLVASGETNQEGAILFTGVTLVGGDRIFVRETSVPHPYVLDPTVQTITLVDNEVTEVVFSNERQPWELIVEKQGEEGEAIAGAIFEASRYDDFRESIQFETNTEGMASIGGASPSDAGLWYVREMHVPEPYLLDDTVHQLEIAFGQTARLTLANKKVTGRIELIKKDEETSERLAGAVYRFEHESGLTFEETTEGEGTISVNRLPLGRYTVQEIKAPVGYVIDDQAHALDLVYVDAETETSVTTKELTNRQIYGRIRIVKRESSNGAPIAGAIFAIIDSAGHEVATLQTDENGNAESEDLPYGHYSVQEVSTPAAFYFEPFETEIDIVEDAQVIVVDVSNERISLVLRVRKHAADTEEPLSGAVFEVFSEDGEKVEVNDNELDPYRLVTDQFGEASASLTLGIGNYLLVEIMPPAGYVTSEPQPFSVDRATENIVLESGSRLHEQVVTDSPTTIEIVKLDETGKPLVDALLRVSDEDGRTVAIFYSEGSPYVLRRLTVGKTYILEEMHVPEGYVTPDPLTIEVTDTAEIQRFQLINEPTVVEIEKKDEHGEPLAGATLQVKDEDGDIITQFDTGKTPKILTHLSVGKTYWLEEIATPDGYATAAPKSFTVLDTTEIQPVELVNEPTVVAIEKKDEHGEPLAGATLQVKDEDGDIITQFDTEKTPKILTHLSIGKTYWLEEIATPDGYATAAPISFSILDTTEIQPVELVNEPTVVEIEKKDENGEPLAGAKLQIKDEAGHIVTDFYSATTPHVVPRLTAGKTYTIEEVAAPEGYVLSAPIVFDVLDTAEVQRVEMLNEPTVIEIDKRDRKTNEPLPNMTFHVIKDDLTMLFEQGEDGVYRQSDAGSPDVVTDDEGKARIERLASGEYRVVEAFTPGYLRDAEGRDILLSDKEGKENPHLISWFNERLPIHVQKVDLASKRPLTGARFQLLDEAGQALGFFFEDGAYHFFEGGETTIEVDDEGRFSMLGVLPGTYYLKEIKAPGGYLLADPLVFHVTGEETEAIQLVFDNRAMPLPSTGESDAWTLLGTLCLLNGAGLVTIKKLLTGGRKRDQPRRR